MRRILVHLLLAIPASSVLEDGHAAFLATKLGANASERTDVLHAPHGGHSHAKPSIGTSVGMASIAGGSTVLGALVIFLMPEGPSPQAMAFSLSLAAGVMVSISLEMLVPHGDEWKSPLFPSIVVGISFLCCWLLCKLGDYLSTGDAGAKDLGAGDESPRQQWRLSWLLFVSLTAHNFPEGFAVAVSAASGLRLGFALCVAVCLHNIPEGITLAVATYRASNSRLRAVMMTVFSGLAEPLGALIAVLLLQAYLTSEVVDHLLTAVAGIMLYIAIAELLPEAVSTKCWPAIVSGFVLGACIMVCTHWMIDSAMESGHLRERNGKIEPAPLHEWGMNHPNITR